MKSRLENAVAAVVENGNCSGCGGCALLSSRVSMELSDEGFMRPIVEPALTGRPDDREIARSFSRICPGRRLSAPAPESESVHPTLGRHVSSWRAWAADPDVRFRGSSGGVLTAISTWLVESGQTQSVVGSAGSLVKPTRTVAVRITTREEALRSSGSRYGPVSNLTAYSPDGNVNALVGKPCEVSAAQQFHDLKGTPSSERPISLAFFCAGVPSQRATDGLVNLLGIAESDVKNLKYRGEGWPGEFVVTPRTGEARGISYEESWGQHLGKDLQWRCKLCPDGTGAHADIAVGDYWDADEAGFPEFTEQEGVSVAIARTRRGHDLLLEAARLGIIVLEPLDLDLVAKIQPLQVKRRRVLFGRLVGRVLSGKRIPRFTGYHLLKMAVKFPGQNRDAIVGTKSRSRSGDDA
jgi:coenzyme F420 hydrogenase subunit beta